MPTDYETIIFWILETAVLLFIIIGFVKRICSKNQSCKKSKENLIKDIFENEITPIDYNINSIQKDKKKLPPLPKPPQIIKHFLENDNIFALYDNNYVEYYDLNHTEFGWCKYFTNSLLQQQEFFENLDNLKEISIDEAKDLITKAKEGKTVDLMITLYDWHGLGDYDYLCELSTKVKHEHFKDISIPKFDEKYYIFLSIKRMTYAVPFSISLIFGPQYNSDSPIGEKVYFEYDLKNFVFEEYRMN